MFAADELASISHFEPDVGIWSSLALRGEAPGVGIGTALGDQMEE